VRELIALIERLAINSTIEEPVDYANNYAYYQNIVVKWARDVGFGIGTNLGVTFGELKLFICVEGGKVTITRTNAINPVHGVTISNLNADQSYEFLQKMWLEETKAKVGSKVRIKPPTHTVEEQWWLWKLSEKIDKALVGWEGTVTDITSDGIEVNVNFLVPYFRLEVIT
jgi:hypothetical protein